MMLQATSKAPRRVVAYFCTLCMVVCKPATKMMPIVYPGWETWLYDYCDIASYVSQYLSSTLHPSQQHDRLCDP